MTTERVGTVVLAAGSGRRMHSALNKPYLQIGERPILFYSLQRLAALNAVRELVLVVRQADRARVQSELLDAYDFPIEIQVAIGGPQRQDSALAGLKAFSRTPDLVLIHDGVRPFFSEQLVTQLIAAAQTHRAALPGLPVQETIREVSVQSFAGPPLDREGLLITQTPQCYEYGLLYEALRRATEARCYFTDEAGAVLAMMGVAARVIPGEARNIKITTPGDRELAERLLDLAVD
jgi:2-C-methyl-D-erythritol 4-phosphate cytidylyltransferase